MADDTGPTPWTRRGGGLPGPSDDDTVAHPPLAVPRQPADAPTIADDDGAAPPPSAPPPPEAPQKANKRSGVDPLTAVAIGGVVVLAVAIIVAVAALNARDDDRASGATTTTTATTAAPVGPETTAATAGPTATDAATTVPVEPPTVADLGADLRCSDLAEAGASYSQAVVYWSTHGESALLDSDGDAIPCETTYPSADVALLWGESDDPTVTEGLDDGLLCRDLVAQDITYADAAGYWAAQGQPERMDDDGDGIPCETTYDAADVAAFWG